MKRRVEVTLTAIALAALLAGCEQKSAEMSMSDAMKPPPRAPELDRLNVFVGRWEDQGEGTMNGQTMKFAGTATMNWEADRQVLAARGEFSMGEGGPKMQELGLWTWDPRAKEYQTFSFMSFGEISHGTATYDEASNTWKVKGKSRNTTTGETSCAEGTLRMTDNNTMEWSFTKWDSWKMKKQMEAKGTSKRRP